MSEQTSYLGWKIDFSTPRGERALQHPSSMQWKIFKNQVALGIGGVAAVLMEFADPRIRSGVWDHSTYKADPIGRSKRTGIAAMADGMGISYEEALATAMREVPVGRMSRPEDIAGTVAWLLGPDSRGVTGQAIDQNGGAWM